MLNKCDQNKTIIQCIINTYILVCGAYSRSDEGAAAVMIPFSGCGPTSRPSNHAS